MATRDPSSNRATEGHNEAPLREDVRRLGALVGEILEEQLGRPFFDRVEAVRTLAIARRTGQPEGALVDALKDVPVETAEALTRAFSTYFQVVNLAERVHRVRRRKAHQRAGEPPQPESLLATLHHLAAEGIDKHALLACVAALDVEPVFTAHPTEATRDELLEKEQEMIGALMDELERDDVPAERARVRDRLRTALTASWQTSEVAPVRPTVEDEVEHACFYLAGPVYRVLPRLHTLLRGALQAAYDANVVLPRFLRFGTWVGGDMDGNPSVGAETITATFRTQRRIVLSRYEGEVDALARLLTQTTDRVTVAPDVLQQLEAYRTRMPEVAKGVRSRHVDMPYRVLLTFVHARIAATRDEQDARYEHPGELLADLRLVANSLAAHAGAHAGLRAVERLVLRVGAFGFHLARLDTRQDSRVHAEAIAALLEAPDWAALDDAAQRDRLATHARGTSFPVPDAEAARATRAVFAALAAARARYGDDALGLSIISMARRAADLLAVLALARHGGVVDDKGNVALDIVPLLETVDDLKAGTTMLSALLDDEVYRAHLRARGDHQIVMLGYSDSAKDGGIVASRWALQRAQIDLGVIAKARGIALTFFHGRGGSASRGGGRVGPALRASPRGSVAGHFRVTEQGEVIARKYGIRVLAVRELEQAISATLEATLRPRPPDAREATWRHVMTDLADRGRAHYRALVTADRFVDYFRLATPIDVIERLGLGSRPARRGALTGIESLRAIPWVFAWNQCRSILTAWYGLGTALEAVAKHGGEARLVEMAHDWPFFTTLLDDVDMVLAKSDLAIAERFSKLAGPLHEVFFPMIAEEHARTTKWVLALRGHDELLAKEQRLLRSIRLRNPYIDPMSFIQIDLLARWRTHGSDDEMLLRALVATVSGVARGLQNTG